MLFDLRALHRGHTISAGFFRDGREGLEPGSAAAVVPVKEQQQRDQTHWVLQLVQL